MVVATLVALGPGVASADETDSVQDVVADVRAELRETVERGKSAATPGGTADQAGPAENTAADTAVRTRDSGSGTGGRSAEEPGSTARAQVVEVDLGEKSVVDVARSGASTNGDGHSSSGATLLALGGQEIIGAHADSRAENESHAGDPLAPLCEGSEGRLCLRVLFADAYAEEGSSGARSLAQGGVADACVGGGGSDPREECTGPVSAELLTSRAWTRRDKTDGSTRGGSESAAADVCVGPDAGSCAVGAELLKAYSAASSKGTTEGRSTLVRVELGGREVVSAGDPADVAVQPGCAGPSLLCVAMNEGSSTVQEGAASAAHDALNAGVLPDTLDVDLGISRTQVVATAGDEVAGVEQEAIGDTVAGLHSSGGPRVVAAAAGILPRAGGVWSGLLAIALGAVAAGSFLVARNRRRLGADT